MTDAQEQSRHYPYQYAFCAMGAGVVFTWGVGGRETPIHDGDAFTHFAVCKMLTTPNCFPIRGTVNKRPPHLAGELLESLVARGDAADALGETMHNVFVMTGTLVMLAVVDPTVDYFPGVMTAPEPPGGNDPGAPTNNVRRLR